jgi:CheY-like chemotaxis protein
MSDSEATSFSVLVVEDDAAIRDSLAEVLQEDGFAVLRGRFESCNSR